VTLPVLFTILSYAYLTLSLIFRWAMHRSKLVSIYKAIQPIQYSHAAMEKKVKWSKIKIVNSSISTTAPDDHISLAGPRSISSYQELLDYTTRSGRVTLRGENGAGKSTLLMLIKNSLSDRAFFLPTQNQLSFTSETNKYSTGESLRNRLLEILERVDVDVLLLDEWDANLDKENQERLSLLIDELAEKKCVIEVRHR
jgi:ABC-type transport system involved in cytochrome bd biosynthesis fused ATPase/permease subunit